MGYPEFPLLTKEQIEVKVKQVTDKGAVALIYKTARTDMDMLDDIVGRMNWQCSYRDIDGVMYCAISIRDPENSNLWITKEDCGIESRADDGNEKKGESSDAFKRAGFRWGIGRELYTAPFIFLNVPTVDGKFLKNKYQKFFVDSIAYDSKRCISELTIMDGKGEKVFTYVKKTRPKGASESRQGKFAAMPESKMVGKTVTADSTPTANPAPVDSENGVSQQMLNDLIAGIVKDMDVKQKMKIAAQIKKINGTASYLDIGDGEKRRELYEHLKNYIKEENING